MQILFSLFALLKTTPAYKSSLHLIFKNIQKGSSTNTGFPTLHEAQRSIIWLFHHPMINVSKTLGRKGEKELAKVSLLCYNQLCVTWKVGEMILHFKSLPSRKWCQWGAPRNTVKTKSWTFQSGRLQLNKKKTFSTIGKSTDGYQW